MQEVIVTSFYYTVDFYTGACFLLLQHGAAWVPSAVYLIRPHALLGRYSYGIYIWHLLAAQVVLDHLPGLDYGSSTPLAQLAKYGAAVVAGITATVLVGRPVLRLRDRLVPAAARVDARPPADAGEAVALPSPPAAQSVRVAA